MSSSEHYSDFASWIELSQKAFKNNILIYRKIMKPGNLLGCVLKGNAYGHGFLECLNLLHSEVDLIFLIDPMDAFKIREFEKQQGILNKRIIVLGAVSASEVIECAKKNIETVVSDVTWVNYIETLKEYAKISGAAFKTIPVHIHIDTGLGREGFTLDNLAYKLDFLEKNQNILHVKGIMSHFSNVEDVTEQDYAFEQISNLKQAFEIINKKFSPQHNIEMHIAQSAASLILQESTFHIARVGISLYGLWPSQETKISARVVWPELPKLTPVLSWKCKSQSIKSINQGSFIGYGCTYRADRDLKVGLLPVGYFDGYPRSLSHKAFVLVNGKRCKVLGRVMMNHIIVDVTEAVKNESSVVATLIGTDGKESISVDTVANWAETINYEIITRIGSHLKRIIVD